MTTRSTEYLAFHLQSSDRVIELSLQRHKKQWIIYRPTRNELGKIVGWSIGMASCTDNEHHAITGERSTSVWNTNAQTYGTYRERWSASGELMEIHLKVSPHQHYAFTSTI